MSNNNRPVSVKALILTRVVRDIIFICKGRGRSRHQVNHELAKSEDLRPSTVSAALDEAVADRHLAVVDGNLFRATERGLTAAIYALEFVPAKTAARPASPPVAGPAPNPAEYQVVDDMGADTVAPYRWKPSFCATLMQPFYRAPQVCTCLCQRRLPSTLSVCREE